jgi:hypothetical protein
MEMQLPGYHQTKHLDVNMYPAKLALKQSTHSGLPHQKRMQFCEFSAIVK